MKNWIDGAALTASALAAILWLCSAFVRTPTLFSVEVTATVRIDPEIPSGEGIGRGFGTSKELTALGKSLIWQSRLSAAAAIFTAIAVICQAFSFKISN